MSTRGQGRVSLVALGVLHGALLFGMTEPPRAAAAAAGAPIAAPTPAGAALEPGHVLILQLAK